MGQLTGGKKKTPIGKFKKSGSPMAVRTSAKSISELIKHLAASTKNWGMVVRDAPEQPEGAEIGLNILLQDGRAAIRAKVEVRRPKGLPKGSMALVVKAMDQASRVTWTRAQQLRKKSKDYVAVSNGVPDALGQDSGTAQNATDKAVTPINPIEVSSQLSKNTQQEKMQVESPTQAPTRESAFKEVPSPSPAQVQQAESQLETPQDTQPQATNRSAIEDESQAQEIHVSEKPHATGALEQSLRRMVLLDEDRDLEKLKAVSANMEQAQGPILGIDLGTTNSCGAIVKNGKPFVIPSRRGHNTIPSVVAINEVGDELVGHAAKAQMEINPGRTIYGSKRLVGRPFDSPVVREVRDRFHYKIVKGEDNSASVQIDDKILSLEQVAAMILTEIRDTAQEYLGGYIERAVITVPAFFNENQRQAVRKAGELAGFKVERILNEPTAAAITFGMKAEGDRTLLVYDLGGGTFDATLLEMKGNTFEVLSTGGDTFLGGVDFDNQLMDHVLIEFQLSLGKMPEIDRVAYLRVLQGAEFAKRTLSSKNEARITLPFIGRLDGQPVNLDLTVDRKTFEHLVTPMVDRTMDVCESVLAQRGLGTDVVDDILLVGGQTRMPLIWDKIRNLFGKEPLKGVHPDESVAIGAALMGKSINKKASFKLVDVLPMSIGIGVPGGTFRKVISAGTALPASRTYGLYTYLDNQTKMVIPVYQGEASDVDENELLGIVELTGIEPGPAGSKMIEMTFGLTQECLLRVTAKERDGGELADVQLSTRDSMMNLISKLDSVANTESPSPDDEKLQSTPDEKPGEKKDEDIVPESGFSAKIRDAWNWVKNLFYRARKG